MRTLFAALALAGALLCAPVAHAGKLRAAAYWGGADFPFSCAAVRDHRDAIKAMDPATRLYWVRKFKISRKMLRQAKACLK